jgi:hypothetical protein
VALAATAKEGDGTLAGTASAAPTRDIVVQLASNLSSRLSVPATVTLKAAQTTASLNVTVVEDTIINGTQNATVTASAENWTSGTATVAVADNDATMTLTLPASGWAGQTLAGAGTVKIGGTLASALVVNLVSSDPTVLAMPSSVTIAAGQTSATFNVALVQDNAKVGTRSATVTATASGLPATTSAAVTVHDSTLDHLGFDAIPTTQARTAGTPFSVNGARVQRGRRADRDIRGHGGDAHRSRADECEPAGDADDV